MTIKDWAGSASCIGLMLMVPAVSAVEQAAEPTTAFSVPVSPSVVATLASSGNRLVLLALWRGSPQWYSSGAHRGASYSGGQIGVFGASLEYGQIRLDLSFNAVTHIATIGGRHTPVPPNTNVLLIDGVDRPDGGRVAKAMFVDPGNANLDVRLGSLAPLLGRSPEIVAFLRCDAGSVAKRTTPCGELIRP